MNATRRMRKILFLWSVTAAGINGGCSWMVERFSSEGDASNGITYYLGGAGPMGHVGSFDVPHGLHDAGYPGRVEVFAWQGISHARDQIDLEQNRETARDLSSTIRSYHARHPDQPINIVALSAGTGIATFAMEDLPERVQIQNAVFLGCSMSSQYDLTRALRRIRGRLYVFYSPHDQMLRNIVRYTGTVDREFGPGIAGLVGFERPATAAKDAKTVYEKIRNIPYRSDFAWTGYSGGHMDSTSREFIRYYIAGIVQGDDSRLAEAAPPAPRASPRPGSSARRSAQTDEPS